MNVLYYKPWKIKKIVKFITFVLVTEEPVQISYFQPK